MEKRWDFQLSCSFETSDHEEKIALSEYLRKRDGILYGLQK